MYCLKTTATFDSAHFLSGYHGKCANLHGHHWIVEVTIAKIDLQTEGEKRGMVVDFSELKQAVRELADDFDHALIYEEKTLQRATIEALLAEGFRLIAVPFRPTAEHFARHFYETLQKNGLPVRTVTVYETPDNCASFEEVSV